jgi:hypothetical protein
LQEIKIHLSAWDGYQLEKGGDLSWLFAPLATLLDVEKTLGGIAKGSTEMLTTHIIERWSEELIRFGKGQAAHLVVSEAVENKVSEWSEACSRVKRFNGQAC